VEDGTKDQWKQHLDKHGGRKKFQIDLALQLMDYAICLDWVRARVRADVHI
jgi:hypothetical protein